MHNAKVTCDELRSFYNSMRSNYMTVLEKSLIRIKQLEPQLKMSIPGNFSLYAANHSALAKQERYVYH